MSTCFCSWLKDSLKFLTILRNDMTNIKWNDLAWNDLPMEQSDQIPVQAKNGTFHWLKGCTTVRNSLNIKML